MNRFARLIPLLAAALIAVSAPRAVGAHPPGNAASAVNAPLPWPERLPVESGLKKETIALKGAGWRPMGTIERVQRPITPVHLGLREHAQATRQQQEDWVLIRSRLVESADGVEAVVEKPGAFLYVSAEGDTDQPATTRAAFMFRFISARRDATAKSSKVVIERTWFALYDPLPVKTVPGDPQPTEPPPVRGLVVLMPGMFGTPVDQIVGLTKRLRQEGYCVLRMMSQPSRFTESVTYTLPLEGDFSQAVPPIAADLTDRAAEAAYAVEAAVLYAMQERPELVDLPRAAVGMSGGAMLLPIVLSRDPASWCGAVSIAGGVDYLRILSASNYVNWINAVRVKWTGAGGGEGAPVAPSEARLAEIAKAYRLAAPLDSANLAPALKALPWLLLHATTDRAVPAATGEELWQLLDKPQRIAVKGGHEWIFMTLSARYGAIADWLNARMPARQPAEFVR